MIAISALGQDTTTTNASLVLSEGVSLLTDRPIHTLKHGEPALGGATDSVLCSRTRNQARHSYIRQSVCLLPAACWQALAASSRQQATRQVQVSAQLCVCVRVCVCQRARKLAAFAKQYAALLRSANTKSLRTFVRRQAAKPSSAGRRRSGIEKQAHTQAQCSFAR